MIHYFAATLRRYGGDFANARLVVSIGDDCEPFDVDAERPHLARHGIEWRWVNRDAFRAHSYFATGLDRWAEPFDTDYVLMADADMLILGDFSDAAARLPASSPVIAGVTATMPPWLGRGKGDIDRQCWKELFSVAGLAEPVFDCAHPGYGVFYPCGSGMDAAPPYYNFGFVLGTREAMNAIASTFRQDYLLASDFMQTDLCAQAGLTLSIMRNTVTYRALPVRYNFWAHEKYYEAFPAEAADVRILHYLNGPFRKHEDNGSPAQVAAWIRAHEDDMGAHDRFIHGAVSKAHAAVLAESPGECS
jgi:hypothetical protein